MQEEDISIEFTGTIPWLLCEVTFSSPFISILKMNLVYGRHIFLHNKDQPISTVVYSDTQEITQLPCIGRRCKLSTLNYALYRVIIVLVNRLSYRCHCQSSQDICCSILGTKTASLHNKPKVDVHPEH